MTCMQILKWAVYQDDGSEGDIGKTFRVYLKLALASRVYRWIYALTMLSHHGSLTPRFLIQGGFCNHPFLLYRFTNERVLILSMLAAASHLQPGKA